MFVYALPAKQAVRVWDFIFQEGLLGMVKVSLGIISFLGEDLVSLDALGMDLLFKSLKGDKKRRSKRGPQTTTSNITNMLKSTDFSRIFQKQNNTSQSRNRSYTDNFELQLNFKELDIDEVLDFTREINLDLSMPEMVQDYEEKTKKKLPEPYRTILSDCSTFPKSLHKFHDFQSDLNFYFMKTELFEKNSTPVSGGDLLNDEDHMQVLTSEV